MTPELIFQDDAAPLRDPKWARDVGDVCEKAGLPKVCFHVGGADGDVGR